MYLRALKRAGLLAFIVLVASSCGSLTQEAPAAKKAAAKVKLVLPQGVSLKPGGRISAPNPKFNAAKITSIGLTVTAADIDSPLSGIIPLETLTLDIDVPSGSARTFTVTVTTDIGTVFTGSQTTDLVPSSQIDLAISVTVVNIAPPPSGVAAISGDGQAAVSWTAAEGADSYNVYYGTAAGVTTANGTKISNAASGGAITGLTNGAPYYFVVTAVNAGGESAPSSAVSATPQPPVPAVPTGVSATAGNAQVAVSWTASGGAAKYNVYRNGALLISVTGTSHTDTTAANGTTYSYTVTAVNGGGESAQSSAVSATPQPPIPATPTGVSATAGNAQVAVSWTASAGAAKYNVYRNGVLLISVTGTSHTDTTAVNGTTYSYTVTAMNGGGESAPSSAISATPQVPVPGAPTGLVATSGNVQVSLAWMPAAAVPNATISYTVYRSTISGALGGPVGTSPSPSYTDVSVTNGTTYYYSVTASNAGGESVASAEASALPQVPAPGAPTGVSAIAGNGQVSLMWTAVNGATNYNVYYGVSSGVTASTGTKVGGAISGGAITGLANGTMYYFIVTAMSAGGESAASLQAGATPQVPAPGQPTGLNVTAGNAQVSLTWTAVPPIPNAAITYTVTRIPAFANAVSGLTAPSYMDSAVTNGTSYSYTVTAVDAGGTGTASTQASATPQVPAPGQPTGLSATAGNAQVTVSWTAATGATSYNVYYGTAAGVTTANGTKISNAASGGVITGLTNGAPYYFVVTAVNAGGEVASGTVSASPQVPAPGQPTGLSVTAGNAQVSLAWTAVTAVPNATITYSVHRSTASGAQGVAITTGLSTASYTDITAVNGTTYYYSVTAVDAGGTGTASTQASATPQVPAPSAPTGVSVTSNNGQVTLTWTNPSSLPNETSRTYNVYYASTLANAVVVGGTNANTTRITGAASGHSITGLNSGTTYYFIVTAQNAGGESAPSSPVSTMFVLNGNVSVNLGPVAPTGVSATAGVGQVTVNWNVTGGAASYNVYYATATGVNKSSSSTKNITGTSAMISSLTNGTTYYFVVTAVDASGESGISSEVSATPQVAVPAAPSGLSATAGNGTATVSWSPASGASSYNLYYSTWTGVSKTLYTVKIPNAVSGQPISGLASGTTYFFVVAGMNAAGEGAESGQVSATTIPAVPTGVTVTGGAGQAVLRWNPVYGASSYNVYYSTSSGASTGNGTRVNGVYSGGAIGGLALSTTYYFVVTAVDAAGEGAASGEVSATTLSGTPTGVSVVPGNASATVSWTAVSGAASYNVYYGTTAGVTAANGIKVVGATSGGAVINLTNGTTYYFIVTSFSSSESGASAEVSTMPFNPAGAWTAKTSMPVSLMGLSASSINGTVYATGGEVYGVNCANTTVNAYNPSTDAWTSKAGMPTARSGLGTAVVDGKLYAIGGHGAGANCYVYHAENEMYDPATNLWTAKAAMPTARTALSAAAVNGVIYAIGGTSNISTAVATVEAYDASANTWSTIAPMPVAVLRATSAVVNGIVYVIGGTPNGTAKYSTVQAYNPATNTWAMKAAMPTAREQLAGAVVNGKIYVFGGVNSAGATVAAVEVYDPSSDTWSTASSLPAATAYLAAAQANGIVYALGGTSWVPYTTYLTATAFTPGGYIAPVTGVAVVAASGQNTLSWTSYAGATSYNIYWSTKDGVSQATATKIAGVASGYVHTGLTAGTRYYYVVTAVTAGGETSFGNEISAVQ